MEHFRLERACEIQVAMSAIDEGITIPDNVLAISQKGAREPGLAKLIFDALVRQVDKKDTSYKN